MRITRIAIMILCALPVLNTDVFAQQGKAVFEGKGNCWTCHGKNAKGTPLAPDLTDAEWLNVDGTLAAIRSLVVAGVAKPLRFPAPMPAMGGGKLSQGEIDAVAAYVFGLRNAPASTNADTTPPAAAGHAMHAQSSPGRPMMGAHHHSHNRCGHSTYSCRW